ncbi:hypothetical protein [Rossellomorea aquimaris]|uniref:Uncharacterized protein n=1 Tax=Rossellomorea aquimaris TaxID=189382 RepID=A0A1J6W4U4_9BACI|nr:hypothetical protein [Rossellomorea aquimaris]OIU66888.1 hypothetical protein BHE18_13325 [Rossellomorea aquimaris]
MKRKAVAFTAILFAFIGVGWLVESQDRFNRGIIETDDPSTANLQPVRYGGTGDIEEVPANNQRIRQPFRSREYIRVVPSRSPLTNEAVE